MLTIRACATPKPETNGFQLPKRLARARRVAESKRMDTLRNLHEALKKTAKDEHEFVKDLFVKRSDAFDEAAAAEEEEIEKSE
jgi:hypothetical protein